MYAIVILVIAQQTFNERPVAIRTPTTNNMEEFYLQSFKRWSQPVNRQSCLTSQAPGSAGSVFSLCHVEHVIRLLAKVETSFDHK